MLEIIQQAIKSHDKYQIEIKLDYELLDDKETHYRIYTYIFVPHSLDINQDSYQKKDFYRDVQNYIRLKTPVLGLDDFGKLPTSPLVNIQQLIKINGWNHDNQLQERVIRSLKMLSAMLKSSLREHFNLIHKRIAEAPKSAKIHQIIHNLIEEFVNGTSHFTSDYRTLFAAFNLPSVNKEVFRAYSLTDESISLLIEEAAVEMYQIVETYLKSEKRQLLLAQLQARVKTETKHRLARGYTSILMMDEGNETYIFRASVLKKYAASVLHLSTAVSREGRGMEHFLFAIAAGVSMIIATTIDLDLQKKAGQLIYQTLENSGKKKNVRQGALVSLDGTGAIRALVGGKEYAESQFNRATDAKRQPGSAFKPFVYLAALEAGRSPSSIRTDAPVRIGKWTPENYDKKYRGEVSLTTALSISLNTISAQLVMETGPGTVIKLARRLGIRSKISNNASIALGTSETSLLELTSAFTPFANGGYRAEPFLIKRITSSEGKILFERTSKPPKRVVRPRELGMMNMMLATALQSGTGKNARLRNWPAAGKTGTSQKSRDGWFIGYTANLTTGIWYGNDDGTPTAKVTGGGLPARTWAKFMQYAHNNVPVENLPGNFAPLIASVPKSRPIVPVSAIRQTTGAIQPPVELGQPPRKPRTILDLLFGD